MPLHQKLRELLNPDFVAILETADQTGDFSPLEGRLNHFAEDDLHMRPFEGEEGSKYYKPFVQTVVPKIVPAWREALRLTSFPEIELLAAETERTRANLRIDRLGSPQDFLYGFTSERYKDWGPTLGAMGFQSACMTAQASAIVTVAPRYLSLEHPDISIDELEGAISTDFWESIGTVFGEQSFREEAESLVALLGINGLDLGNLDETTAESLRNALTERVNSNAVPPEADFKVRRMISRIQEKVNLAGPIPARLKATRQLFSARKAKTKDKQEQIALKYVEEGKFLQKLLGGSRVEHLQSNVKMVRNIMRGNKCEVDSIYRVVGEKKIVLVEAKGGDHVSRSQLYQLYETYRLRLPFDWELDIVAVLLHAPPADFNNIVTVIDLVNVNFEAQNFGKITESLLAIKPKLHYKWNIRRRQPA